MSQVIELPPSIWEPAPKRIRWTRAQCEAMRESGFLPERYELIDGEILSIMSQNPPHRRVLIRLRGWLIALFGNDRVQSQAPIEIGDVDPEHNEPEPDAAVTAEPTDAYADRNPGPEDLLLVAEVSDTTLKFDRGPKARLYARAGIVEYWVLDVTGRMLYVHREPGPGGYAKVIAFGPDETVALLSRPESPVRVSDLLPPLA